MWEGYLGSTSQILLCGKKVRSATSTLAIIILCGKVLLANSLCIRKGLLISCSFLLIFLYVVAVLIFSAKIKCAALLLVIMKNENFMGVVSAQYLEKWVIHLIVSQKIMTVTE